MVQIILIRPGATDYDDEQRIQGTLDIPLNALGDSEVARVIDDLSDRTIEAVYSPSCEPANQTADTLAQALGVKHKKCAGLQNVDHGLWQGMKVEEVRRKHPKVYRQWQEQPESVCPPEGEMLEQAEKRMRAALAKILKKHKQGTVALVVPEPMASLVQRFADNSELGDLWQSTSVHGKWDVLDITPELVAQDG
ncbi:MAG: histidine phosphatase family protein [Pirellulales bacterium]|nr:histidine phosphatase family protein [Pirellulales bacterium]